MGVGDEIIGSGLARGAYDRGKLVAFGDGRRIDWGPYCEPIYRGNPNVARPGQERLPNLEWIKHYRGHRIYNKISGIRWKWNYDFKVRPGELFIAESERASIGVREPIVIIEPNLPQLPTGPKPGALNKRWPVERYQVVVDELVRWGCSVVQFHYPGMLHRLKGVHEFHTLAFRNALATLNERMVYVGPEGGMSHAAAAMGMRAVVLFGGFAPPQVLGYDSHMNLTGGAPSACGSLHYCDHCKQAMLKIGVDEVVAAAKALVGEFSGAV